MSCSSDNSPCTNSFVRFHPLIFANWAMAFRASSGFVLRISFVSRCSTSSRVAMSFSSRRACRLSMAALIFGFFRSSCPVTPRTASLPV
jgi:hypothetical protein